MAGKKILLVDDDKAVQDVCLQWFKDSYSFETASDPVDAYDKAMRNKFDLFIIDIKLSASGNGKQKEKYGNIRNGIELASRLRTSPRYIFTPIIILTGMIENEEEIQLVKQQMKRKVTLVQKPFQLPDLQKEVESFIGKPEGRMSFLRKIFRLK